MFYGVLEKNAHMTKSVKESTLPGGGLEIHISTRPIALNAWKDFLSKNAKKGNKSSTDINDIDPYKCNIEGGKVYTNLFLMAI